MNTTGTVIVSLIVGAGLGYAAAKLLEPSACSDQLIVVDRNSPNPLADRHVCKDPGHLVTWRSKDGSPIAVAWAEITPSTAPYPYSLECDNYTSSSCFSGPMAANAQVGSSAKYLVKFQDGTTKNGRIIIDR